MASKVESAAIRVTKTGDGVVVSVIHRGRRGTQTVVRRAGSAAVPAAIEDAVKDVYEQARKRLRFPEEV